MTKVLVTVDTELSALLHQRGLTPRQNFASSILGQCKAGEFGIGWQMDRLEAAGLKGVFFVDPMPALVYDEAIVANIVAPIIARGHEVQLHIHTEWLEWAKASPVGTRLGGNLADFSLEDQVTLLTCAADLIERAGAPRPTAFRAGNFGANDDSLRALAKIGLRWDSSVNAAYLNQGCKIGCDAGQIDPIARHGVIEVPVSGLFDRPGRMRPAQICALSTREMRAALSHAASQGQDPFVIVTHSFEMLSRDRSRPNGSVMARFVAMCHTIAEHPALESAGFDDLDVALAEPHVQTTSRLEPSLMRTAARMAEQALATWRYERQLRPI
ncbi:MAG: polysaccharide deacetylase family protein [Sphingomonadaceae bacterium]